MKPEYDLSKLKSRKNPYASRLKKPVTKRNYKGEWVRGLDTAPAPF